MKFTDEQQREINRIVEGRLAQERRRLLSEHANEIAQLKEQHAETVAALHVEIIRLRVRQRGGWFRQLLGRWRSQDAQA